MLPQCHFQRSHNQFKRNQRDALKGNASVTRSNSHFEALHDNNEDSNLYENLHDKENISQDI